MRPIRLFPPLIIAFSLLAATACGAGQVAQTATQRITQEGANASRGGVGLRAVLVATPLLGAYKSGDNASMYLAISTEESVSDTLVSVTTDAAASVTLIRSVLQPPSSSSPAPGSSPDAAQPASPAASAGLEIAGGSLLVLAQGASYLELRGLTRDLRPGTTITVTFSFAKAGDITLDVPVATPDIAGPRVKSSTAPNAE